MFSYRPFRYAADTIETGHPREVTWRLDRHPLGRVVGGDVTERRSAVHHRSELQRRSAALARGDDGVAANRAGQ